MNEGYTGNYFRYIPHSFIYKQEKSCLLLPGYDTKNLAYLVPVSSESRKRSKCYQIQDSEVNGKTNQKVDPSP